MTDAFVRDLYNAAPLHDIGKVGISDLILLKPDRHTPEEFEIMKTHTTIGARTLQEVRSGIRGTRSSPWVWRSRSPTTSATTAAAIPAGSSVRRFPVAAQIMAIADVYDALRSPRRYKPAFDHAASVRIMTEGDGRTMPVHFGPGILPVFKTVAAEFDAVYTRL